MSIEIKVPVLGESVVEATVAKWMKNVGEKVNADEPIVELETDKVSLEVPSPKAGVLTDIVAQEGDTVEVDAILALLQEGAVAAAESKQPIENKNEEKIQPQAANLSPAVRRLVEENNLDARDKAFVKNLTLTSIRNRGILENVISKYLERPLPKKLTEIKAILIMGIAQILFTRIEDYAAVNTTVNFFEGRLKKWRGLSNAILRKIIREENYKNKKYELRLNVPEWLYKVWKKQYGEKNFLTHFWQL